MNLARHVYVRAFTVQCGDLCRSFRSAFVVDSALGL